MKRLKEHLTTKKGFSMVEMMAVVAIILILAAFSFVAVITYQRSLKLTEMDETAKEIFVAAQNHLTVVKTTGMIDDNDGNDEYLIHKAGAELDETLKKILPMGSMDDTVRVSGSYIIQINAKTGIVKNVFYSDSSRFGYNFTKENDLSGGTFSDALKNAMKKTDDAKKLRKNFGRDKKVIGYYGGADASVAEEAVEDPEIKLVNKEILYAQVTCASEDDAVALVVTGNTSGATRILSSPSSSDRAKGASLVDTDMASYNKDGIHRFVLDDLSTPNKNFASIFSDGSKDRLIPGEDITVYAIAYRGSVESGKIISSEGSLGKSKKAVSNSLFANITPNGETESYTGVIAGIANFRHLENLDENNSLVNNIELNATVKNPEVQKVTVTDAVQQADLVWMLSDVDNTGKNADNKSFVNRIMRYHGDWLYGDLKNDERDGTYSAVTLYSKQGTDGAFASNDNSYLPLNQAYDLKYDGKKYRIKNVKIITTDKTLKGDNRKDADKNAGLFGRMTNHLEVKDLELDNFDIKATSSNAGTLVGKTIGYTNAGKHSYRGGLVISNVLVRNYGTKHSVIAVNGYAGGLVGHYDKTNEGEGGAGDNKCSIENVAVSAYVNGQKGAGGLIGYIDDSTLTVTDSYVAGHTVDGEYGTNVPGLKNGSSDTEAKDTDAKRINVVSYGMDSSCAGGFVGLIKQPSTVTVQNFYSTASVFATKKAGTLVGNFSGKDSSIATKVFLNVYADTKAYAAKDGKISDDTVELEETKAEVENASKGKSASVSVSSQVDSSKQSDSYPYDKTLRTDKKKGRYPFKNIIDLDSKLTSAQKEELPWYIKNHVGDWENRIENYNGTIMKFENDDVLAVHIALPKGTNIFTMAVTGEETGLTYMAPFKINNDNSVGWQKFTDSLNDGLWQGMKDKPDYYLGNGCRFVSVEPKKDYLEATAATKMGDTYTKLPESDPQLTDDMVYVRITLDELRYESNKQENGPFAALFDGVVESDNPYWPVKGLRPGENITVRILPNAWNNSKDILKLEGVTANSLFANTTDDDKNTAYISSFRHLENLEENISGINKKITTVKLLDDLDWDKYMYPDSLNSKQGYLYSGIYTGSAACQNGCYYPVSNSNITNIDGAGHSIIGVYSDSDNKYMSNVKQTNREKIGIFSSFDKDVTITDLKIKDIKLLTTEYNGHVGALVGSANSNVTFNNVSTDGYIYVNEGTDGSGKDLNNASSSGGLIGIVYGNLQIRDVRLNSELRVKSKNDTVGGIVGHVLGEFEVNNSCDVTFAPGSQSNYLIGKGGAGLLAGAVGGTSTGNWVNSKFLVNGASVTLNGVEQKSYCPVTIKSANTGTGGNDAGGLIGYCNGTFTVDESSTVNLQFKRNGNLISSDSEHAGGLCGYVTQNVNLKGTCIVNCDPAGDEAAEENPALQITSGVGDNLTAGGLFGTIEGQNSPKSVINHSLVMGHTVAWAYGTGNTCSGGLVGNAWNDLEIKNSAGAIFAGSLSSKRNNATFVGCSGGLIGLMAGGTIEKSYASGRTYGSVFGENISIYAAQVGGLVGRANNVTINNTYATNSILGNDYAGGLVGVMRGGSLNDSYWAGNVSKGQNNTKVGALVGYLDLDNNGNNNLKNYFLETQVDSVGTNRKGKLGAEVKRVGESPFAQSSNTSALPYDNLGNTYPYRTIDTAAFDIDGVTYYHIGDWQKSGIDIYEQGNANPVAHALFNAVESSKKPAGTIILRDGKYYVLNKSVDTFNVSASDLTEIHFEKPYTTNATSGMEIGDIYRDQNDPESSDKTKGYYVVVFAYEPANLQRENEVAKYSGYENYYLDVTVNGRKTTYILAKIETY